MPRSSSAPSVNVAASSQLLAVPPPHYAALLLLRNFANRRASFTPLSWRAPIPSPVRAACSSYSRFGPLLHSPARTARSSDRRTAPTRDDPLANPETLSLVRAYRAALPRAGSASSPRPPRICGTPSAAGRPPYAASPRPAPSTHAQNGASSPATHSID